MRLFPLLAVLLALALPAQARLQVLLPNATAKSEAIKLPEGNTAVAVRVDKAGLQALQAQDELEIALPNGESHAYVVDRREQRPGGIQNVMARHREHGKPFRAVITVGPAGTWAVFETPRGEHRILPDNGRELLVDDTGFVNVTPTLHGEDDSLAPPPDVKREPLGKPPQPYFETFDGLAPKATPAPIYDIDLMVVYTPSIAARLGAGLMARLEFIVARANTTFADSEIAVRLRLVRAVEVNYNENVNDLVAINHVTPSCTQLACGQDGFRRDIFGHVEAMRTAAGADLVMLWRGTGETGGSGRGWLGFDPPNPVLGYSLVTGCVTGCENLHIHEIGHNLGVHHDRPTVSQQNGGTAFPTGGAYPYSFGYAYCASGQLSCNPELPSSSGGCFAPPECSTQDGGNFVDVMGYFYASARLNYKFSNPAVTCSGSDGVGRPCGVAQGDAKAADGAGTINRLRDKIAAMKSTVDPPPPPPTFVGFVARDIVLAESSTTVVLTVERTGNLQGAAQVRWRTKDGTATEGLDYGAASGQLVWASGEGGSKVIQVPVFADTVEEGVETFYVELYEPGVLVETHIVGLRTATITLVPGTWPPANAVPAGFVTPDTSGVAWTVDASTGHEGSTSLATPALVAPSGGVAQARMTYTGDFAQGVVTFAYRTSLWQGNRTYFEFAMDGMVLLRKNGMLDWTVFSVEIPAGRHTLSWTVRSEDSQACGAVWAGCADRAWVDAISLPVALPAAGIAFTSSPNPSATGAAVTLRADLSGTQGTPTGTVGFFLGNEPISQCSRVQVENGRATCITSALPAGSHVVTARYSGDVRYQGGNGATLTHTVQGSTSTVLARAPESVDFGGQSMGTTSPPVSVTVTNTGGTTVNVSSVTPSDARFAVSHACSALAPGASCTITVRFSPTAAAGSLNATFDVTGSISIASNAPGSPHAIALHGVAEKSLVTHFYRSILRRAPDAAGKDFWHAEALRLGALAADVNEAWFAMATYFFFSPEYTALARDSAGFVTDLYGTFFNRAPDSGGLAFWTGQLAQGMPREVVLASFLFSAEFDAFTRSIFGNTSARAEVDMVMDFYRGLLARLPDNAGFDFWLQRFRAAQCAGANAVRDEAAAIGDQFAGGGEYAGRGRTNAQFVGDLYNAILRRGGDLEGVAHWVRQLDGNTMTRDQVRRQFMATPEFDSRVQSVLAQGCM